MNTDLVFRILVLVLFASFIAHRGYYTRKYGDPDKKSEKERAETPVVKVANSLSLIALLATVLYIVWPDWMAWSALALPEWLRWSGVVLALLGFGLLPWAHWALGKNWSDKPRLLAEQTLTTIGPYQWIRHPIYTAFLLILTAPLFLSANWFVGGLWVGLTVIETLARVEFEESILLEKFGEQYRRYMQHTGRLWPRLGR
jgi:protein-S-isoprenylcysteine O-methyltransferase Ste14